MKSFLAHISPTEDMPWLRLARVSKLYKKEGEEQKWRLSFCMEGELGLPTAEEVEQLKAEINGLKEEVVELKFELKAEVHRHVAYRAAHDEDIQKLKQKVDKLTARVTAVPDDDPSLQEC